MDFVLHAPFDERIISMDCNDGCESISRLAERVAAGEKLEDLLPEFQQHMQHWKDCREEFEALVAILRAEYAAEQYNHLLPSDEQPSADQPA